METDVHFARLLADLPEALVCDEAFLGELAKNAKLISVKKVICASMSFWVILLP